MGKSETTRWETLFPIEEQSLKRSSGDKITLIKAMRHFDISRGFSTVFGQRRTVESPGLRLTFTHTAKLYLLLKWSIIVFHLVFYTRTIVSSALFAPFNSARLFSLSPFSCDRKFSQLPAKVSLHCRRGDLVWPRLNTQLLREFVRI